MSSTKPISRSVRSLNQGVTSGSSSARRAHHKERKTKASIIVPTEDEAGGGIGSHGTHSHSHGGVGDSNKTGNAGDDSSYSAGGSVGEEKSGLFMSSANIQGSTASIIANDLYTRYVSNPFAPSHHSQPEEVQRRRSIELDDRRNKEWLEYQRLYRQESATLPKVFLDIYIGEDRNSMPHRVVIELFNENVPKTCDNFRDLCLGQSGWIPNQHGGVKLDFADTRCSRIVPGLGCIFGDMNGLSLSSKNGGQQLADENFSLRHNARGIVTMVSAGPNTVGSHFMICFDRLTQLDFKYVPFGRVVEGFPVLEKLEHHVATTITNIPKVPVVIVMSGALSGKKPIPVTPPAGLPLVQPIAAAGVNEGEHQHDE